MALSKVSPDPTRAEELARRLKIILDANMLRDPLLNGKEMEVARAIRAKLEEMGLCVTTSYKVDLKPGDPLSYNVDTEVKLWLATNLTLE